MWVVAGRHFLLCPALTCWARERGTSWLPGSWIEPSDGSWLTYEGMRCIDPRPGTYSLMSGLSEFSLLPVTNNVPDSSPKILPGYRREGTWENAGLLWVPVSEMLHVFELKVTKCVLSAVVAVVTDTGPAETAPCLDRRSCSSFSGLVI